MCGFAVSNTLRLNDSNQFCQRRGPDLTNSRIINNVEFLHNLLHITGSLTPQPLQQGDVVCVFNGEIYNYKKFGNYTSDGQCLLDLYNQLGIEFTKQLDGEFSICLIDFAKQIILISNDTFSCKPLWYEFKSKDFCIGSYNSQLAGLGFANGQKLKANLTKIYDLKTLTLVKEFNNKNFDIKQHKNSFDDWLQAFQNSIAKRTANTDKGMFVGLSSGYDSGAIACELTRQNVNFKAFSIVNNENEKILQARLQVLKNVDAFNLSPEEFQKWKSDLRSNCENFEYDGYDIKGDQASMGLAAICNRAKKEGRRIYFSGQGADEIISDYGFNGKKIYKHSGFGGLFPTNLEGFFPWHSFYNGTQIKYLNKEEYVAGHFGIETRYPFLDNDLVQEFLWLDSRLKNSKYKSCLDEYLKVNNFPYQPEEKRGFHVTDKGKKVKTL